MKIKYIGHINYSLNGNNYGGDFEKLFTDWCQEKGLMMVAEPDNLSNRYDIYEKEDNEQD